MQSAPHFRSDLSIMAILLIVMAVVAALAVGRRHGLGIGGLLALAVAGVVLFMFLGSVVTYRRVELAPPVVAMSVPGPHGEVHVNMSAEPPIDELWERLNESRIELSSAAEEASVQHKAATADRAAAEGAEAVDPPAADETPVEELASDGVAEAASDENEGDEAPDAPPAEDAHAETAGEPAVREGEVVESSESAAAAEATAPSAEQAPPPVEPAQPAAEPFADPFGGDSAEPFAPAAREAREAREAAAVPDPEPEPRPDWVAAPPKVVENIYRVPVQAGPYVTLRECYDQLRNEMRSVVQQRVEELVRESTGLRHVHIPDLDWMHIGGAYIDRELLTDQYVEINDTSVGAMRTAWGLLEFTPNHDRYLVDSWKRYARQDRMAMVATMAALVVGALGGVLLLLKIDTWTRGYYTKRLFLGVPAAIIALLALGIMIAEM